MNRQPLSPELLICGSRDDLAVRRDGVEVFRGSFADLIATDRRPDWLVLRGGEHITVDLPGPAASLLAEFSPSDQVRSALDATDLEMDENDRYLELRPPERPVFRADIHINGQRWGWMRLGGEDRRWHLVPADFQDRATTVLRVSAANMAAMINPCNESGVRWAPPVALLYQWDEIYGATFVEFHYDCDDPAPLVDVCADLTMGETHFWAGPGVHCPWCEEDTWEPYVETAPPLGDDAAGRVISFLWRPCDEHLAEADDLMVEVMDELWWWSGETWVKARVTPPRLGCRS